MKTLLKVFAISLVIPACVTAASDPSDQGPDPGDGEGAADGTTNGTYFSCSGLGTNEQTWLWINSNESSISVVIEGSGTNSAKKTTSTSSDTTYSNWTSNTFFGKTDTLVVPDSVLAGDSGKVDWYQANVNPYWEGTCEKKAPSGDQCLALVQEIYPIDSSAKGDYTTVKKGSSYSLTIPSSKVGDFVYDIAAKTTGELCVLGDITNKSCSANIADKIASQARSDGSSSGAPYVSTRKANDDGTYTWTGGVHDAESGEFAYTLTSDSDNADCSVTHTVSTGQD